MLKRSEMLITLIKLSPQKAANAGVARDFFTPKIFHLQTCQRFFINNFEGDLEKLLDS